MKKFVFTSMICCLFAALPFLCGCNSAVKPEETTAVTSNTNASEETTAASSNTDASEETTAASSSTNTDDTFWILASKTDNDQMQNQINQARKYIQEKYPEMEIKVEYLEYDTSEENEMYLDQLRIDILAGNGPDIFLFATADKFRPGLFPNVQQAIQNGHFTDINEYYEADSELGTENLNETIMNAGLWDGGRYVLPLRYNMFVYTVDTERLAQTGKDLEWLASTNVQEMMDEALSENNSFLAECAFPKLSSGKLLSYFPDRIDYTYDNVLMQAAELEAFWSGVNGIVSLASEGRSFHSIENMRLSGIDRYIREGDLPSDYTVPIRAVDLDDAVANVIVCKAKGIDYEILPVRGVDDSVTAWVSWYGAVGSSCDDPALGYEFLRLFLTEDYQWELNRLTYPKESATLNNTSGMVGDGWPVRYRNASEHLYSAYYRGLGLYSAGDMINPAFELYAKRASELTDTTLNDDDLPFLNFTIDHVYFPMELEGQFFSEYYSYPESDTEKKGAPPLMDPAEMAADTLKRITVQIAEG